MKIIGLNKKGCFRFSEGRSRWNLIKVDCVRVGMEGRIVGLSDDGLMRIGTVVISGRRFYVFVYYFFFFSRFF